MATLPKPAEFAVPPERYIRGLLEIAKSRKYSDVLVAFISKNLTLAKNVLDAVTIATLAAELAHLSAPPVIPPEPTEPAPEPAAAQPAQPGPAQPGSAQPGPTQTQEEEILELLGDMREVAVRFQGTLRADFARIEETRRVQEENFSAVTKEQAKSASLKNSGQLGFFCTLLLIAVSVLILALMIPFILVTR